MFETENFNQSLPSFNFSSEERGSPYGRKRLKSPELLMKRWQYQ